MLWREEKIYMDLKKKINQWCKKNKPTKKLKQNSIVEPTDTSIDWFLSSDISALARVFMWMAPNRQY